MQLGAQARETREGTEGLSKGDIEELKRLRGERRAAHGRDVLKRSVVVWVKKATKWAWPLHRRPEDQPPGATPDHLRPAGRLPTWFYKWISRTRTPTEQREAGWTVAEKTVADSMRRQGPVARVVKRRNGLTRQDKTAPKFPDLLRRGFTAAARTARGWAIRPRSPPRPASCTWPR